MRPKTKFFKGARFLRLLAPVLLFATGASSTASAQSRPILGFNKTVYDVDENDGQVDICLSISGSFSDAGATVSTIEGTADAPQDFVPWTDEFFNFSLFGLPTACRPLTIINDQNAEDVESLELLITSSYGVYQGSFTRARVDITDNDGVRATLAAIPDRRGGHVIYTSDADTCFAPTPSGATGQVRYETLLNRPLSRSLETLASLTPGNSVAQVSIDAGQLGAEGATTCTDQPPTELNLSLPSPPPGVGLGTPRSARVEQCRIRIGGVLKLCSDVTTGLSDDDPEEKPCPAEAFFNLECAALAGAQCGQEGFPKSTREAADVSSSTGVNSWTRFDTPVELLRRLRDERMSQTAAGRYYQNLYEAFSPQLNRLLLLDMRTIFEVYQAHGDWLNPLQGLVDGFGDFHTVTAEMIEGMNKTFDSIEARAEQPLQRIMRRERSRLRFDSMRGLSMSEFERQIELRGGPPPCADTATTLCLQNGRFLAEVFWKDFQGGTGVGQARKLSGDTGSFWFFDQDNIELVVKVLDAIGVNDRYWVFFGALSDVEYTLMVTDTQTGAVRLYENASGTFASVGDTDAFSQDGTSTPGNSSVTSERGSRTFLDSFLKGARRTLSSWLPGQGSDPAPGSRRVAGISLVSSVSSSKPSRAHRSTCNPTATTLCLNQGRFRVEVEWEDFQGGSGGGQATDLTTDTGTFWFFDPANTELIVKVLDGTAINGRYWVFFGSLSNVGFSLRVTDTTTGRERVYDNAKGAFGSQGDIDAF